MKKLAFLASIPVFLFIFLHYTSKPVWDYDFWWHLKTGQLIVETKSLPEKDDFTYTSEVEDTVSPGREKFLLRQYWLAQSFMYLIYEKAGFSGIKIMRGAIIALTLAVLFYGLFGRVHPFVSYGMLYLAFDSFGRVTGERPQLFSFLFLMILIVLLDRAKKGKKDMFFIPPLMLLWANMHGGFILGDVVIAILMFSRNLEAFLRKNPYPSAFNAICVLSVLFSFINPNGYAVISQIVGLEKYYSWGIQEFQSPYKIFFEKTGIMKASFMILVGLSAIPLIKILAGKNKKESVDWGNCAVLYMLLLMSMKSARYIIFFGTAGAWLIALETGFIGRLIDRIGQRFPVKSKAAASALALSFILFFYSYKSASFDYSGVFSSSVSRVEYPFDALDFIKKNDIKGRVFNDFAWGGFLSWHLYPESRVFIDSRGLNYGSMLEYSLLVSSIGKAEEGMDVWERILQSYGADFILISPLDINGELYPLMDALYESKRWALVHTSYNSLLFLKETEKYRNVIDKHRLPSEKIIDTSIDYALLKAARSAVNPYALVTLGDLYRRKGENENALKAYELALYRAPGNERAKRAIDELRSPGAKK